MPGNYCMSGTSGVGGGTEPQLEPDHDSSQKLKAKSNTQLWDIDPNHGMHVGPGYLGDAPHSLRAREVFR